nr:zinc finger, CCHC-type [Tanacetum cinerariifolium]
MVAAMKHMALNFAKLEKYEGGVFQKMEKEDVLLAFQHECGVCADYPHARGWRYNDNKGKRKHHDTKADPDKKPKVTCWKCKKPGHLKRDCKGGNVGNKANGSGTKGSEDGSSNPLKGQNMFNESLHMYYVTYVSEEMSQQPLCIDVVV